MSVEEADVITPAGVELEEPLFMQKHCFPIYLPHPKDENCFSKSHLMFIAVRMTEEDIYFSTFEGIQYICWRDPVGCMLGYFQGFTKLPQETSIILLLKSFELKVRLMSTEDYEALGNLLDEILDYRHAKDSDDEARKLISPPHIQRIDDFDYQLAIKQEQYIQFNTLLKFQNRCEILRRILSKRMESKKRIAINKWCKVTEDCNRVRMIADKRRWRLHATNNYNNDLQAWYHTLFYQEIYRLKGRFWFREATLQQYKKSYGVVTNSSMTQLEEAALAHVLCSPDTTYGDVAGQMYVVQATVEKEDPKLGQLFQRLSSEGIDVTKHPRAGMPAKKRFRFSFVEGCIYLTWRGKTGNQGVSLREVTDVVVGLSTDVLKRTGFSARNEKYISLICSERSVDLCLDDNEDRGLWRRILNILVSKEHNKLESTMEFYNTYFPSLRPEEILWDWRCLYACLGQRVLSRCDEETFKKLTSFK